MTLKEARIKVVGIIREAGFKIPGKPIRPLLPESDEQCVRKCKIEAYIEEVRLYRQIVFGIRQLAKGIL